MESQLIRLFKVRFLEGVKFFNAIARYKGKRRKSEIFLKQTKDLKRI